MADTNSAWGSPLEVILVMALAVVGLYVAIKLLGGLFWLTGRVFRAIGRFFRHIFEFVASMVRDALRLVGSLLAAIACVPALLLSMLFMRRSAAMHYGRALRDEVTRGAGCLYRLAIGNLMRLLCLDAVTEGLEQRVPEIIARAPGPDRPSSGPASFPGYRITGSLPGGGSGARLYLAEPDGDKFRQLQRSAPHGVTVPDKLVIKSFSLSDGSTLPQIVRENRALSAARDLGLVLEHELSATRFHYVMPYVPGEDLTAETARLHAASGSAGLDGPGLQRALLLTDDLLSTLQRFHKGGLWHKDVKPGNIIVSDGRAHLVDFGLITPLASAMTLTTHGTEYFRDPEMVRLALKGVKVHEVDGIKFDLYGAGAVLYSLVEGSFPAHGSLSRLTRRCPEALRWIIRRAMADMQHRYVGATEMLDDLRVVSSAPDPFRVRPADLPSLTGRPRVAEALAQPVVQDADEAPEARAATEAATPDAASRGVPVQERRLRPLQPPYGERRWSRKAIAAAAIVVLAIAHFSNSGQDEPGSGQDDQGRARDPSSPPAYGEPVVSSVEGEAGVGDGSLRSGAAVTADDEVLHAVLRNGSIEMLETVSLQTRDADAVAAAPTLLPPVGLVLVLDDLPANAPAERVAAVGELRTRLLAARYALLGCARPEATPATSESDAGDAGAPMPGSASDGMLFSGVDPSTEVELLAGARAAVGLSDPSDPEAVQRLSEYLKQQGTGLDAILWIGRADDEAPVQTRVFARDNEVASALGRLLGARHNG